MNNAELPDGLLSDKNQEVTADVEGDYTYDEALEAIGFGYFQKRVFALTGAVWFADAMEVMLLTFLIPELEDDWDISSLEAGSLGAVVFAGMFLGAWALAIMSDTYGRRPVMIFSLLVVAIFGLMSAFSSNITMLLILRFFVGFAAGGSAVSMTLFTEITPTHDRGKALYWEISCWTFGCIFGVVVAWIFIPCCGWRWFVGMSSIPLWIILCFYEYIPESPRYLLVAGRTSEAEDIIKEIAMLNGKRLPGLSLKNTYHGTQQKVKTSYLWLPAYRLTTNLVFLSFWMCVFVYFGTAFIAEPIFEGSNIYWEMFITTSSEVPGIFIAYYILDIIGRKKTMSIFYILFCLSGFTLAIPAVFDIQAVAVVLVSICRMSISITFNVLYIYILEYYPTVIRNTALGTASSTGRIAGMIASYTVTLLDPRIGIVVLASGSAVGLIANLMLPVETLNRQLPDSLDGHIEDTEPLFTTKQAGFIYTVNSKKVDVVDEAKEST